MPKVVKKEKGAGLEMARPFKPLPFLSMDSHYNGGSRAVAT
jgi:hypothetical protein